MVWSNIYLLPRNLQGEESRCCLQGLMKLQDRVDCSEFLIRLPSPLSSVDGSADPMKVISQRGSVISSISIGKSLCWERGPVSFRGFELLRVQLTIKWFGIWHLTECLHFCHLRGVVMGVASCLCSGRVGFTGAGTPGSHVGFCPPQIVLFSKLHKHTQS